MSSIGAVQPARDTGTHGPAIAGASAGATWVGGRTALAIAFAASIGFLVRLAAARGDLWFDEIWSLKLVASVSSADQIFWRLSHDNNHYLNSLWMFLLGPERSALAYRLPAVLFGTLSIVVAARIGLRRNAAGGIAAAALAALALPLVQYGSEARGYAGLILAVLVSIDACEATLDTPALTRAPDRTIVRGRWVLGAAIGAGTLFHLTMIGTALTLGLWAALRLRNAGHGLRGAVDDAVRVFRPALVLLLPAMLAVAAGVLVRGGFEVGGRSPFSLAHALEGYGGLVSAMVGVPIAAAPGAVLALVAGGLIVARRVGLVGGSRWGLAVVALAVVPGLMVTARLPNLEYPRYFLAAGLVLLVVSAEIFGSAWARGGPARWVAGAVLGAILGGQVLALATLLRDGRGGYSAAVALMSAEGRPVYDSNDAFKNGLVVDYFASRRGLTFRHATAATFCEDRPDWYVLGSEAAQDVPARIATGPGACRASYVARALFPASALSGWQWALYRRAD